MRGLGTGALILAAMFVGVGPGAARQAAPTGVDSTLRPYADTTQSARLPGGRTLHLVCTGHGSPTVILTAGASDWSITWHQVQPAIAARTRVCAWDRAGFGFSTPPAKPQTVDQRTSDLEAALRIAHIPGPYIVVGHSLGGYESILLKDRQPANVIGMVLVDPSFPDQAARFDRVAPAISGYIRTLDNPLGRLFAKCAAALRAGTVRRGGPDPDGCLRAPIWPANYPPELRAALAKLPHDASPALIASAMDTMAYFGSPAQLETDSRIVVRPGRTYGDMPLIVLTAGKFEAPSDFPDAAKAELPVRAAEWQRGHNAYAALSTRGVNRVVANSTHYIQRDDPQVVIAAIDEVLEGTRNAPAAQRLR